MSVIDDYLTGVRSEQTSELERIRGIAKEAVPEAEEAMSYGMPALKYKKRPLLGFTANKRHLSIHPFSPRVIEALKDRLGRFELSRGTIRFTANNPIPESTLKEIISQRLTEIVGSR